MYGVGSVVCLSISGVLGLLIYRQGRVIEEVEATVPLHPQQLFDEISNKYHAKLLAM